MINSSRKKKEGGALLRISANRTGREMLDFTILLTLLLLVVLSLLYFLGWKPSKFIYQEF